MAEFPKNFPAGGTWLDGVNLTIPTYPRFSLPLLDTLIQNRGVDICWYKSIACACRIPGSTQPDKSCTQCFGTGFIHYGATPSRALVTSRHGTTTQHPAQYGVYDQGAVRISFARGISPAVNDKIVVVRDTVTYSNEILTRGEVAPNGESLERLLVEDVISVDRATTTRRVKVDPMQPDEFPYTTQVKEFFSPQHFYLDGNFVKWTGAPPSSAPTDGEFYSMRYVARPTYIIWDDNAVPRWDSVTDELPRTVNARRIDFIRVQGEP